MIYINQRQTLTKITRIDPDLSLNAAARNRYPRKPTSPSQSSLKLIHGFYLSAAPIHPTYALEHFLTPLHSSTHEERG